MANALTDFIRKRDFLVCMDSDGCVMDVALQKNKKQIENRTEK